MKITARKIKLDLNCPIVMGILNVTPDSFSDGGIYNRYDYALKHVASMVNYGAAIIDIGGESTRPGASEVNLQQELDRVIPIIEAVTDRFDVWVSVDTSKAVVITEATRAGAHIINDVRSLHEPGALEAAAETGLPICIMHMLGQPKTMQQTPDYKNVVAKVKQYLSDEIERCEAAGIAKNRLIIDPGFGFGKNLVHNYQLLAKLNEFHALEVPLLVGMSRKSMIGELLDVRLEERLIGGIACAVIAAMQGAQIIRAHDVKETVQAMKIVQATLSVKETDDYE
ncbi:Dihydropteroate synthase [Arsenophonus endosymbiont of Aleurodicus floccissimus]|uniref:dihydropteroate synthase n=1 Tax=Arsenophonus endosymbiont of Aleurodicus floccissimus TaxID=2152761 RepID=UPI000E6AEA33|nr:dihydropteroate synthase [Arsenophonus endosymbiont of Aleurodicus floccissimus]SPP32063.1 Dihydropteroate synthase [Arsenophonus endosymbiont of Aleurodicus floccissimus]